MKILSKLFAKTTSALHRFLKLEKLKAGKLWVELA
jgi:hypothetical protein